MMKNKAFLGSLFAKEQRYKLIMILGVIGIALIFLSDTLSSGDDKESTATQTQASSEDPDEYAARTEKKLCKILSGIESVGSCDVMITVGSATEYVYAENTDRSTETADGSTRESCKSEVVFTEEGGERQALVKKIIRPQISGVIVVCEGGGDVKVRERVINAVSKLLDIPSANICVECRNT